MKDEIIAGLKNALERGESLEKATQSFINAGYNPMEVKSAANSLNQGASTIIGPLDKHRPSFPQNKKPKKFLGIFSEKKHSSQLHKLQQVKINQSGPSTLAAPNQKPKLKSSKWKTTLIIAVIILLVLLIVGGILGIIFTDQLVALFS